MGKRKISSVEDSWPSKPPRLRRVVRLIQSRLWKPYVAWYLRKPRRFRFQGVELLIQPEVFHPGMFYSTRFLIDYLRQFDLRGKSLWELGCGSGLISILAAKQGASVTASDSNPVAIESLRLDALRNRVTLDLMTSDLFAETPRRVFDWIVINPPYYKGNPQTLAQQAWHAGERYEFFDRLFGGIKDYMGGATTTCMVLSDGCDLSRIRSLAHDHGLVLEQKAFKRLAIEDNLIFHIVPARVAR
jgi:release factor glutamine methyltransferase